MRRYNIYGPPGCVKAAGEEGGSWVDASDVVKLERSHAELLEALELAEKKLVRLHLSLSLNEKAGMRSADRDPDVKKIRAAIAKAKATMNP